MPDKITKFIQLLDVKLRRQLKKKLEALKQAPFSMPGVKKMEGIDGVYRLRVGKIRIVYTISDGDIEIIDIDYRGNIY